MTQQKKNNRKFPFSILAADNDPSNWEPKQVIEKFGKFSAEIGEQNVDYVALGYMNSQAFLYWLPDFIQYMRTTAPSDSYHLESIILKLSNYSLVGDLKAEATEDEKAEIFDFLNWLGTQPIMAGAPPLRAAAYAYAVELWRP
jgi:hypothetical protein